MLNPKIENGICVAISRDDFNRLCSLFCAHINVRDCVGPDGGSLDPMQLLIAMGGRESDFGADLKPRFEPSWFEGGAVWRASPQLQAYIAQNGRAGACSYGPLQIMAFDALGFSVSELALDPEAAMSASCGYFNRYVIGHWKCRTLEQICRTWNGGHPTAGTTPGYYEFVLNAYRTERVASPPPMSLCALSSS
jgi:hypothetical protein